MVRVKRLQRPYDPAHAQRQPWPTSASTRAAGGLGHPETRGGLGPLSRWRGPSVGQLRLTRDPVVVAVEPKRIAADDGEVGRRDLGAVDVTRERQAGPAVVGVAA